MQFKKEINDLIEWGEDKNRTKMFYSHKIKLFGNIK